MIVSLLLDFVRTVIVQPIVSVMPHGTVNIPAPGFLQGAIDTANAFVPIGLWWNFAVTLASFAVLLLPVMAAAWVYNVVKP